MSTDTQSNGGFSKEFFQKKGKEGGKATSKKHGKKHYQTMQQRSVVARKKNKTV